ncbi:acyl-CoA dehydrogenase family protein [Streptomyces sp. NPDC056796]|uniref:acyl-CoA dehydrogenase family protein n=1 Tax=Streptomyces sp. NPDC056796 TaxID=3345947 RepID=UPI0036B198BC
MRLTQEQNELRATVRSLLARHEGTDAWRPLTEQIGVASLAVPEKYEGAGCGAVDVHVVMEELGRVLSPVPLLGSAVLAAQLLLATGDDEACARLLPGIADGSAVVGVAWAEDGSWDPAATRATAAPSTAGNRRIDGSKRHVLDGTEADTLLVTARTGLGVSLFEVAPGDPGAHGETTVTMDRTRPLGRWRFEGAEGRLVGTDGGGARALEHALDLARTALAAEQVGAAQACLDLTVAYTKERVQFGRSIGSFQAVKHRLADAYVLVEAARSAALGAAFAAEGAELAGFGRYASVAQAAASEALSTVAGDMIQLHGGIGITWEHDAHRYFKRAHSSAQLFGTPDWHRRRIARSLDLGRPQEEARP